MSKTHGVETIRAAAELGIRDFGESYAQEGATKSASLESLGLHWHFIGQVQSNKTPLVAERFDWVHGVDRLRIAKRLSEHRHHYAQPLNVCLQVKLVEERAKAGVDPAELDALATAVAALPRLKLRGLMCIPPVVSDVTRQRSYFRQLRELLSSLNAAGHALDVLSMGMSDDFEAAIAEGATHVRIGTAIFGPRDK